MSGSLQNKAKVTLQYLYLILSKFFIGMIKGFKFFFIQILIWIAVELFCNLLGYEFYWERFGILALSLQICILTYTMLYSWFYSFAPIRLKNIFIPYLIYASLVYLGIVQEHDWNFKIVTIDEYMLMGWLAPLYGLTILILKVKLKRYLSPKYPKLIKGVRITFYTFASIIMLLAILGWLSLMIKYW